jgi:hypothetical protein
VEDLIEKERGGVMFELFLCVHGRRCGSLPLLGPCDLFPDDLHDATVGAIVSLLSWTMQCEEEDNIECMGPTIYFV